MRLAVKAIGAAALLLASQLSHAQQESCGTKCFPKRWIYFGGNLSLANDVDVLRRLIPDARENGYNGIALNSGGSGSYLKLVAETAEEPYTSIVKKNLDEVIKLAQANNIELIPVGGGPEVPNAFNPQLMEALPASATYNVAGGVASIARTPIDINGHFTTGGGWSMDVGPVSTRPYVSIDKSQGRIASPGETPSSVKLIPATGGNLNSRLIREVKLARNKAYRWSFWIKVSPGYDTKPLFAKVIPVGKKGPIYENASSRLGWGTQPDGTWNAKGNSANPDMIAPGQEWKRYDLDFNTGGHESVNIYLGTQSVGVANTNIWVDDMEIVELGLAHPAARSTTPMMVSSLKTGAVYVAGTDYSLAGQDKTSLDILKTGDIPHDDVLKVSWYQSGANMLARSAAATGCGSHAGAYHAAQKKLYEAIKPYFSGKFAGQKSDRYFMYYDEIRLMNWDPYCSKMTAGEYLRQTVNGATFAIAGLNPVGARPVEILTWNDMFDLQMNAVPSYYHVHGDLSTWKTPLNPSIVIVNWTADRTRTALELEEARKRSLAQFAKGGHKQVVAFYYDHEDMSNVDGWLGVMAASPTVPLDGVMYTTWRRVSPDDYTYEEAYGNLRSVANRMRQAYGTRWPN